MIGSRACHFRSETGEGAGVTYGQPHHQVSAPELGSGTARSPETRDLPEQMRGFSAAGSKPAIAAAGAAATGPAFARPGVPR
jgi:hypothetical protein